jgi:hypothetical protein
MIKLGPPVLRNLLAAVGLGLHAIRRMADLVKDREGSVRREINFATRRTRTLTPNYVRFSSIRLVNPKLPAVFVTAARQISARSDGSDTAKRVT